MNYWLIKSEPDVFSWEKFEKEGKASWDGVRNYAARNNLRSMKKGDLALFYHSNEGKDIVGIARVVKESYQDPTTTETAWLAVDLQPYKKLKKTIPLSQVKTDKILKGMELVRLSRLSVSTVTREQFDRVMELGGL